MILKGLRNCSFNQGFFGIITIAPPLFILLFLSFVTAVLGFFILPQMAIAIAISIFIFAATILWTLKLSKVPSAIWKALWGMPLFVWKQILALFKMGNPDKNFKHSEHTRDLTIDEVLGNDSK